MMTTEQSPDIGNLAAALAKVQGALQPAKRDSTGQIGQTKRKYADLESVVAACREILSTNEVAVMQTGETMDGQPYLATTLAHSSGEWIRGRIPILFSEERQLSDAQTMGKAMTYCRRYGLAALVGVTVEDDDGASAGQGGRRSERQQTAPQINGNEPNPAREPDGKVCLQFNVERTDDWKKALHDAGFRWDADKNSYRAPVTDKSVAFAQNCVTDCGEQLRWHRIPEPEAA